MYKDKRVSIGLGGIFQARYLDNRTKKLEDNNARNNNTNVAQIKTKSAFSKKKNRKQSKSTTKKYLNKIFTKIMLLLLKPKIL